MSQVLVARLSRAVDRRASRRGFLSRSAMGATALAVAPAAYALRPTTAHAAICSCNGSSCNCGDGCCDGYTDFCCHITGENLCPPGTIVAGWWKAHGSGFCDIDGRSKPRYYLDCNLPCDDGCDCAGSGICPETCTGANCRCLEGCHCRAVDCTRFRYGQCNDDVPCVGAIACRIVTCVPPWEWDSSCVNAPATDDNTAFHDRPCLHNGFTDVAPKGFYRDAVEWMVASDITTGYTNDLFGPHEHASRAHFAAFLWRYAGRPDAGTHSPFGDVDTDDWYAGAVAWMVELGLTSGTTPTTFSPDRVVSRAEAITLLWRFAGQPDPGQRHSFDDVARGDYFDAAVSWAFEQEITSGMSPSLFAPDDLTTRAQVATFLYRFDQLLGLEASVVST